MAACRPEVDNPNQTGAGRGWMGAMLLVALLLLICADTPLVHAEGPGPEPPLAVNPAADSPPEYLNFLPALGNASSSSACSTIPGASYATLAPLPPPLRQSAAHNPDFNLIVRGYGPSDASPDYLWLDGPVDPLAPRLRELFDPPRHPALTAGYRVNDWNWTCNCVGEPLQNPPVTLAGMATTPLEVLHVAQVRL